MPAAFVGLLHLVVDDETTNDLFPMVLVALAVPLGLMASPRTRRFGPTCSSAWSSPRWSSVGAASLVLWLMVQRDL